MLPGCRVRVLVRMQTIDMEVTGLDLDELIARRSILDTVPEAVIVAESCGAIRLVNTAAERLLGAPEADLRPNRWQDLLIQATESSTHDEARQRHGWAVRPDGSRIPIVWSLDDRDGQGPLTLCLQRRPTAGGPAARDVLAGSIRMIGRLTALLGMAPGPDRALEEIVRTILDDYGAALSRIWAFGDAGGPHRLLASGVSGHGVRIDPEMTAEERETPPPEVVEVVRGGMPFLVENFEGDPRFDRSWVRRHGLGALVALPLILGESRRGALVVGMSGEATDEHLDILISVAALSAAVLRDAGVFGPDAPEADEPRDREAVAETRRSRAIIDLLPIGVLLASGVDGRITAVNPAGLTVLGGPSGARDLESFCGDPAFRSLEGAPLTPQQRPIWRAFHRGEQLRETLRHRRDDGPDRVFEVNAGPFPGPGGGAIATYLDVTERDVLQNDLAMRAAQLKALLDHLPVGVAYFDAEHRCRACNGPAWKILGRSRSEIIGVHAEELFVDAPALRAALRRCVTEHEPHAQINVPWDESDGLEPPRFLDWRFEPLKTSSGNGFGALALIVDVTARKRTADAMQRAKEQAERSAQNKSRFLSAISHDLRTPTNALNLMAEMLDQSLRNGAADVDTARLSIDLRRASGTLVELVNDLLDLTRFDSGEAVQHPTDFALGEWLDTTLASLSLTARSRGLECSWHLDGPDAWVRADRVKLGRVLTNLVGNAIKFTDEGWVRAVVRLPEDGALTLVVEDTGPGIPSGQIGMIFDEFAQLRNPERDRTKGTGLGLAIIRRLVEAVGGRLAVENREAGGSRFSAIYPVHRLACPRAPSALDPAEGRSTPEGRPLLLLVEDDETTRRPMSQLLELSGYEVDTASDGPEALEALGRRRPSMVLLDLMMPMMDGIEVLRRIRKDSDLDDLPVLVLSGDLLEERGGQLQALGVVGTLTKPIDFDELLTVIGQVAAPI